MFMLNPITAKKVRRFREIRRGYWSFLLLAVMIVLSLGAELLVSNRALLVRFDGRTYFPTYGAIIPGDSFGLGYRYETNYRDLKAKLAETPERGWVLLPLVPFNAVENCYPREYTMPRPPNPTERHFLGTDQLNRDVLARVIYGFRMALIFAGSFVVLTYLIGVSLGCAMGYFGGWIDLVGQRLIEIWSLVPFLFVVIIVASFVSALGGMNLAWLLAVVVLFSWTTITYYLRSATYREKVRDYVHAAQVLGAGTGRVIFTHVLPNVISTLVTFAPFTVASAITSLTALDFIGYGLPPPTPSWGELLRQGTSNLNAPWIVSSAFTALVLVLVLVTFIGEAVREAFDPKKFTKYQ
jgi:microcin C transport system permease protein